MARNDKQNSRATRVGGGTEKCGGYEGMHALEIGWGKECSNRYTNRLFVRLVFFYCICETISEGTMAWDLLKENEMGGWQINLCAARRRFDFFFLLAFNEGWYWAVVSRQRTRKGLTDGCTNGVEQ